MKLCLLSINCNHRHYSLGVYVLAAMVRQHLPEVGVRVHNHSVRTTPRQLLFDVMAEPADVYGLSVHHGHGDRVVALARDIRRLQPGAVVVIGGVDVATLDGASLGGCVDWCVVGEGEWALVHLLQALQRGEEPAPRPGLVRPGQATAAVGAKLLQQTHLDDFPSPYLNGAFDAWDRHPTAYVETYRGCVWNCNFCHEGRGRSGIASYSEARIRAELNLLLARPEVRLIEFYDTIFNVEAARTRWLLRHLIEHNARGVRFIGEFMLEWLDDEEIALLGQARFALMEVGLQSSNLRTLRRSGRKTDLDRFAERARAVLERTDTDLCIDAMYGLDDETLDDFTATLDWIGHLEGSNGRRPTPILFATHVHPATRLFRRKGQTMLLDAARGGRPLTTATLALRDTERFYEIFYGYLCLRATFPRSMNRVTGALLHLAGIELSQVYAGVARVLKADAETRVVFEQADWSEFRSNPMLRLYLDAIDRRYLLAVADELGAAGDGLIEELQRCIALEQGEPAAPLEPDPRGASTAAA
ncbi:B12-binding domain-containing protein [Rubrivivax sp. A210]|uniref:B12-binding domain-containing radical SAM protein n=1 Tax=Rubrivivax sp. A210 TaxID=2772301 RepID=UPI00191B1C59|nr:radical SAM protein [Rubrivivax sp. A210]CAD5366166.1 B12-binding domain-containing protein [Rubrivivax sp. A210]